MLLNIFGRLFRSGKSSVLRGLDIKSRKSEADDLRAMGKLHEAIDLYRECLEVDRFNVDLLNSLGACLDDIGDDEAGRECFELAYSIDDTYIAGVVNYAKKLADKRDSTRALALLEYVNVCEPDYNHVHPIYASVCFARGDAERAADFQLKGWLGSFDSLRMANSYLFTLAYSGDEQRLASEHRFWAETLRKVDLSEDLNLAQREAGESGRSVPSLPTLMNGERKLRIGYWSPDLRGHSVSYFFRPLLENHDRSRYEIYVYHDSFKSDAVTEAVRASSDHFHDVYLMNDVQLFELMRSHQLDILVEMAGHTSANRLMLFKDNRFATVQISGIGYPPTTGLSTVDAKVLDCHIFNDKASNFYAEKPMVLPSSFWCFDPMEVDEAQITKILPIDRNGYITFGCVGNISKITKKVMECWVRIMASVPSCRLLIRSISFEDASSRDAMAKSMLASGLDMSRVDLVVAVGGKEFFDSYNDIDIILDTYPFNGGTTTCFATYMGVPVITRAGDSLISRMGLSAMANLGASEWVAHDDDSYVANAIKAANDHQFLQSFRGQARECFRSSALGDGRLFAAHFEEACESLLKEQNRGVLKCQNTIPALPANELMRRVYAILQSGNGEAAARVLNHCLDHYPDYGGAHLFIALQMGEKGMLAEAVAYLNDRLDGFDAVDKVASMISIIRWSLLMGDKLQAGEWLRRALELNTDDHFDAMQLRLYRSCLTDASTALVAQHVELAVQRLVVMVPCDDIDYFQAIEMRLRSLCRIPAGCVVTYVRCPEQARARHYKKWMNSGEADVLLIMQRVAEVVNSGFYVDVLSALSEFDVVGVAGATRWTRSHWRGDRFEVKTAGFMVESREADGFLEVQCLGVSDGLLVGGQAVLDGVMLALRPGQITVDVFDDELASLNWALEEDWTHSAAKAGARLAVHRSLGILVHDTPQQDRRLRYPGLLRLQEKNNFPLFAVERDDGMVLSAPVKDALEAMAVMREFCFK